MSCDNGRETGHVAKVAVLGLAQARDPQLAAWIEENVTFPCTMVDRIVPAATPETLQEIADQLGVYDPCAIACEPFRQWVIEDTMVDRIVPAATPETLQEIADQLGVYDPCAIACEPFRQWGSEDNFVNGRPDWDKVGAQFVADVVPFEMMKLRMLNGSHSFLAYLGYLGGYETIADTMTNPDYRKAAFALMMQEQAPTLSMPEGTDLNAYLGYLGGYETIADTMTNPDYRKAAFALMMQEQAPTLSMPEGTDLNADATLLIERFSNPSLRHRTWQIAMDGSQKLPQRLLDPVRLHLQNGGSWRHLALGVAGWMRYTQGVDEQGNAERLCDAADRAFQQPVSASPYLADCNGRQPEVTAASAGPGASAPAKRR